jgi:hypothetical protein
MISDVISSNYFIIISTMRRIRWAGHVARMGEGTGVYTGFWLGPLGRPRRRWEDNIRMELGEIGIDGGTGFSWLRIGSSGGLV